MLCFRVKTEVKEMGKMFVMKKGLPVFSKRKILEYLADILEDENLISPLEKIALKEKINKYEGTFL